MHDPFRLAELHAAREQENFQISRFDGEFPIGFRFVGLFGLSGQVSLHFLDLGLLDSGDSSNGGGVWLWCLRTWHLLPHVIDERLTDLVSGL